MCLWESECVYKSILPTSLVFFFSPPHRRRRRSFVLFHKITKQSSLSPPLIRLPFSLLLLFCFSNRNCGRHRGDPFFIQFPSLDFSSSRRLSPPSIHLSTVIRDTHTHKLGSVFIPFRLFSHWNTRNEIEIACWSSFLFSNKKKKKDLLKPEVLIRIFFKPSLSHILYLI